MKHPLMEALTRQIGSNAEQVAFRMHPELEVLSPQRQEQILKEVEHIRRAQQWPTTVEYVDKAYKLWQANEQVEREIHGQVTEFPSPHPSAERSEQSVRKFLETASTTEISDYLKQQRRSENVVLR